jgi:hypothetical protein
MKRYAILFAGLLLAGCDNSLKESPKTFISPDAFFTTKASYETAVKGIYSSMTGYFGQNNLGMREMFSDICGAPSSSIEQALPTYQNNHQPFFYNVRGEWANNYSLIKNANFVLDKLGTSTIETAAKEALSAEARCLRAFAYFQLVQFFGDVPLRTTPITDYAQVQIARAPQAEVYKLIVDDLIYAEARLADTPPQQGRVSKWVATAMLARVYLAMAGKPTNKTEYYQQARDKAVAVINSGKYQLLDDYSKVFQNMAYTSESIWEVQFIAGLGGNGLHSMSCTAAGYNTFLNPATWFVGSFPAGDQRKAWGIRSDYAGPDGKVLPVFFQKFVKNSLIDNRTLQSASTALVDFSLPVIRLAEMYLIAAEAENEVNGPANAYAWINKIRWRARVDKSNPAHVPDLSGLSKDAFRQAVLMERKWELHLEGSSWFDLKRTGTLSRIQTVLKTDLVHPIGAYNETWYIPDTEITNNNIAQNPAYQ